MYTYSYNSPLGKIFFASDSVCLQGLWLEGQKHFASTLYSVTSANYLCLPKKDLPVFQQTAKWLTIYFSGEKPDFTPPLNPQGNQFEKTVWNILLKIPYGKTTTYGQIAKQVAKQKGIKSMSAQAVGRAIGHNPISLIIPCHRVIGANGNLTGYAGGTDKKLFLLKLENAIL